MRLNYLYITNFLSFGPECRIALTKAGLTLIEGENRDDPSATSNGAGKSAVIEALVWCLYGITLRGYEGDDVINLRHGKDCSVSLTMDDGSASWTVTRSRKHHTLKTGLRLLRGASSPASWVPSDVTGPSVQATQEMIDRLMGMKVTTFLNSVVFGQSASYRFSTLTDRQQKEVLDEALGTAQYARACDVAREDGKAARIEREHLQVQVLALRGSVTSYEVEIAEMATCDAGYATAKKARTKVLREQVRERRMELAAHVLQDVDAAEKKVKDARDSVTIWEERYDTLRGQAAHLDAQLDVAHHNLKKARTAEALHKTLTGFCDTCGQDIDEENAAHRLAQLETECTRAEEAVASRVGGVLVATERSEKARALRKKYEGVVTALETARHEAKRSVERAAVLRQRVDEAQASVATAALEESPFAPMVLRAKKKHEKVVGELAVIAAKVAESEASMRRYDFWIEAFGAKGVRSLLIDSALPFLNDKAASYARTLTAGNISVEFRTQTELKSGKTTERFEVVVQNRHGAGSYKGHSAGERAKIDLVVGLSLQALVCSRSKKTNVVFFDEPFESLDESAVDRVLQLLTETFDDRESVFVITHNEAFKAFFPSVLTVIKEGGTSRVE